MKVIPISGPRRGRGEALPGTAGRRPERGGIDAVVLKKAEAKNQKSEMWESEKGIASRRSREEDF